MKTREEIFAHEYLKQIGCLDNRGVKEELLEQVSIGAHQYAFNAMDEYAKQQAIAFALWKIENRWFHFENGFWLQTMEHPTAMSSKTYKKHHTKTSEELHSQFIESQNK